MRVKIAFVGENLSLVFGNEKSFAYNLNEIVDLTDLVSEIALFEEAIEIEPATPDDLFTDETSDELKKLTEYVFQILEAFNQAFYEFNMTEAKGNFDDPSETESDFSQDFQPEEKGDDPPF